MPILPENKSRYPKNWKEIRKKILERAENACECCGLDNYQIGYRDKMGGFVPADNGMEWEEEDAPRLFKVVLTIAHLDHTPENCNFENLRAFCQKCHNNYDQKHRQRNRQTRKEKRVGQTSLLDFIK